jgi:uncharacterized repeat protein (TIGR03843 family)
VLPGELDHRTVLELLRCGDVAVEGRMPWSSNGTFLTTVCHGGIEVQAVYKPIRGERPLWDFPAGLYKRETAAYLLSEHLGFGIVPPTVIRDEAPLGRGSLQLFVPSDFEQHYFTVYEQHPELHDTLRQMCAFDIVANNTDRKGGHCLLGLDGHVWAIDNGLCFAAEFKLRTVIWEFGGETIPGDIVDAVGRVTESVPVTLAALLDADEIDALHDRARTLVASRTFPTDRTGRRYPWPLV